MGTGQPTKGVPKVGPTKAHLRGRPLGLYKQEGGAIPLTLASLLAAGPLAGASLVASSSSCSHGSSNSECDASSHMCGLRGGAALAAQRRAVREVVHTTALSASICTTPMRYRSSATVRLVVIP